MTELWSEPWFAWGIVIVVGLPILLVVLTEVHAALQRSGSPAAKPVRFVRNFVVPIAALLGLFALVPTGQIEVTWTRVVATVFGFAVILALLSGVDVVLFRTAKPGTWRDRVPSIFIDIGRILLIVVALALLFSWVWNADVGGLFAALGVTSIVIGLALQNAVGSVVSGLLLLFEQPFRLGDWLDTGVVRGRVIEVNWRAVHIDTGNGIQIVPNAALAGSSFRNLSRTTGAYAVTVPVTFSADDRPHDVLALLASVANRLPYLASGAVAGASHTGPGAYTVTVPIASPSAEDDALSTLQTWLWYASRRRGLALGGGTPEPEPIEELRAALEAGLPSLGLALDDVEPILASSVLERYAAGETVQRADRVPGGLRLLTEGVIELVVAVDGIPTPIGTVEAGGYLGQNALTRERAGATGVARTPVTTVLIRVESLDELVQVRPALAREIGRLAEHRREAERAVRAQPRRTSGSGISG